MCLILNTHFISKINSISLFACQAYGAILNPKSYTKIRLLKALTQVLGYLPAKLFNIGSINESHYTMQQWYNWNITKNFKTSLDRATIKQYRRQKDKYQADTPSDRQLNHSEIFDNDTSATHASANRVRYKKVGLKQLDFEYSSLKKNSNRCQISYLDYRDYMPEITIPIYSISSKGDGFVAPSSGCALYLNDFYHPHNVFRNFSIESGSLEDYSHTRMFISHNAAKEIWPTVLAWIKQHSHQ